MKIGYLSQYFAGVVAKVLSQVEADGNRSNQHEFNGVKELKEIFGTAPDKQHFSTIFMYLDDSEDAIFADGFITWYDSRANSPTRSEHRMYYPTNDVSEYMKAGDTLFICKTVDGKAVVIVAQQGSSIESQLRWLFDVANEQNNDMVVRTNFESERSRINLTSRLILEKIGIEVDEEDKDYLEEMIQRFDGNLPKTKIFSEYARSTVKDVSSIEEPDKTLLKWVEREESLFRTMEKYLIAERLRQGFMNENQDVDVDGFISFSLSVQNRRKSRVGQALENHIEQIFIDNDIRYSRTAVTEGKSKPDFILPSIEEYRDADYLVKYLTMLGVKSTCKDRWRQVLDEADRIEHKHLLTLEAAISENQTEAMKSRNLQLVLPKEIHETYTTKQQGWLYSVSDFLNEVRDKRKE